MIKKLHFNAVGLYNKTSALHRLLTRAKSKIPSDHTAKHKKIDLLIDRIEFIFLQMDKIREELLPTLKKEFSIDFKSPELLYIALARPNVRSIFKDINAYFKGNTGISRDELDELSAVGDAGNVLALIGDAILNMAVLETFWDSSLVTTGQMSKKKEALVSNKNLARYCDNLELYAYRIYDLIEDKKSAKTKTITHEKGTLVEALIGVLYMEQDYSFILRVVPKLQ